MESKPKDLVKVKDLAMRITWTDGHVSTYSFRALRLNCPCAHCKNELTGEDLIDPATIPEDLKGLDAALVGNYALRFTFSDGHSTGIYPFETLRKRCPCDECSSQKS